MTALPNVKEPAQQGQTKVEGYIIGHLDNGPGYELGGGAGFGDFYEGPIPKVFPETNPQAATLIIAPPGSTSPPEVMTKEDHDALVARLRSLVGELTGALDSTECLDNGCPLPTWQKGYDEMCAKRSAALLRAKAEGFNHEEQKS